MSEKTQTFEMVINTCFGGYGLSLAAAQEVANRKGQKLIVEGSGGSTAFWIEGHEFKSLDEVWGRFDPDVIAVVKDLGERANGFSARLKVVEVLVEIDLDTRDGFETVVVSGHAR
jgi:hydrogenase maturation factor